MRNFYFFFISVMMISCGSGTNDEMETYNLSDSTLAKLPDCNFYYCDTLQKSRIDTMPCHNAMVRTRKYSNLNYYVIYESNLNDKKTPSIKDTFFITNNYHWFHRYHSTWNLLFSPENFAIKKETFLLRDNYGAANIEKWIPDTISVSKQYGVLYIFKIDYPESKEESDTKFYFSPAVGIVNISNNNSSFCMNQTDTIH